ncbi:hypothetical protein Tco_1356473, partial [Tanacetum coccineum]
MSSVRQLPKEKGPNKLKAAPLKPKLAVKPKAAPFKPKPAVKQSVSKRNRYVDDVVSDVINYLYDSKVVKRKKSVEDEDSVGSDDDEANQTEEESNNDEESNKDEEINEAEENDQQLVNSSCESEDEMVKKCGKKTKVVLKSKKHEHVKGKKKDVISEFDSKSEAEMVKKRGKKMKVALKSKKREPVSEDKVLKVKKNLKKKKKQVSDSSSSFEEEKPIMKKKKKLDAKKKKKKPITLAQIKKEKYLRGFPPLYSRTVPCSLFSAIRDSHVDMKSFLSDIGFSSLHNVFIDTLPSRFSRFVVRAFNASTYEFKLEKGVIRVTPDKVGGTSIFDLPERPLDDDFVKMWFNQFDPKP